jgi:hypothetical protein
MVLNQSFGPEVPGRRFACALVGNHVEMELLAFLEVIHASPLDGADVNERAE